MNSAKDIIEKLGLMAHPEGGWFAETYRAEARVQWESQERTASTSIYFLLEKGQRSAFHRIDSDEMWHHYQGAAIRITLLEEAGPRVIDVGPLSDGLSPQAWVPAGVWFGAEPLGKGDYTLVGCTVAPGFEFSSFEMAQREALLERWPDHRELIVRLT